MANHRGPEAKDGLKQCHKCKATKSTDDFFKKQKTPDGFNHWCTSCCDNKGSYRRHKLARRCRLYGISVAEFLALYALQGGKCAICRTEISIADKTLRVDHAHSCCPGRKACGKCVRGLLCAVCNVVLGGVHDSVTELQEFIRYLEARVGKDTKSVDAPAVV